MLPVSIYTLGCKLNQLESEAIAGVFKKAGFPLVPWGAPMEGPSLIIINTCTVTAKADQKARRVIRQALRENPQACVIVAGCYARLEPAAIMAIEAEMAANGRLFIPGTDNACGAGAAKSSLLELPEFLRANDTIALDSSVLPQILQSWVGADHTPSLQAFNFLPGDFTFHSRGYLKIQDGCNSSCSYCRTRLARGPSVSLPPEAALAQLCSLENAGTAEFHLATVCSEVMITGVNITQYSHPGFDLARLLEYLLDGSSTIALRLSSLEPEGVTEKLVAVLAHPRIRPHFHLSVQSGSDDVLRTMYRSYTSQAVENAAALLRSVKDDPFLACDIIAGFPGETEADFTQTLALCEKTGFAWIHAFPFSPRPGTAAVDFPNPVHEREKAERVEALTKLARQGRQDYARRWLGRELSAIVEKSPPGHGQLPACHAVSENYLKLLVNCPGEAPAPGTTLRCVPVSPGTDVDLIGNLLEKDSEKKSLVY